MSGSLDELPVLMLQLRELIQEGHGLAKDLTRLLRDARQVRDNLPREVTEKIDKAVADGLEEYREALGKAIEGATDATYRRFDVLTAICLGQDPHSVRTGVTTVPDLLRDYIKAKGLPYRLEHVPPGPAKGEPS